MSEHWRVCWDYNGTTVAVTAPEPRMIPTKGHIEAIRASLERDSGQRYVADWDYVARTVTVRVQRGEVPA